MDTGKSMEDQFSKLHPSFPVSTRIAILGGGPSGLSAAYALCKLGYNNVTVLEKHHTVSGMCLAADIEGRIYDLGGQVVAASSSPTIFHLAKETGSDLEEMDSHKLALIDSHTGKYEDIKVADDYVSSISLTLELQDKAKNSGRIGVHAISDLASDSTPSFLEAHGFKSVPKSVAYGYTASGYGFVQDMPYAYIHEFTRTSMAGKIRRFKGGYMSMWQKISKSLPVEVLCNAEVMAIRRNSSNVNIDVRKNDGNTMTMEFDKVIISGSFPFENGRTYRSPSLMPQDAENGVLDYSELEKELFSKVKTIDYYTTVLKINSLDHLPVGFFYFGEFMDDPSTLGNPVAMQKFYSDTNIFLFWSYGNSADIRGQEVTRLAVNAVERMGGEVEIVILQQRFKYFPHVESQDMKDGFYEKLETKLQGQQNTYYIGGLMAFELTERNSSYAMSLVRKHFATDDLIPRFPYVKRLFTLKSELRDKMPRKLDESKGVEFPDLSSLDCYLKHWGKHSITCNKILYRWINDEGAVIGQRTFQELNANASCIAEKLLSSRKPVINPGDRVLLVHVPGLDFTDAFFGCLRARVMPVPVLPPDPLQRGGQALLKIENIAKSCNAVAILSTMGYQLAVRAGSVRNLISLSNKKGKASGRWPNLPWLHTDSWVKNSKDSPFPSLVCDASPRGDELCFLQFTSGSTGDAKGVVITHGALIHNVKLMKMRYQSTSNTVLISWLPQYHDMGLIGGLFTALVSGATAVLFSPMTFIKNPLLWLETVTKYRGTHSAGPNFAFELVVRRLEVDKTKNRPYDLSSMVFLMIAAEPVRQKTLKRFIDLTSPYGLSQYVMAPGYGLAENCVFVSCAYGEAKPILVDWQGRVCCGYVSPHDKDVDILIVDPETGEEKIESGDEGEIWISSPSAGFGYWGREELNESTFRNKIPSHRGKIYMRTGDLGRLIDGNFFITGRIKDLIIVAGKNIYSADVEKTVESSCELLRPGCCAVIGVPEDVLSTKGISIPDTSDHVGLVVIAETRDGKSVTKDNVEKIKSKVAEEHGVSLAAVKLIKPRTISKTTSGKIRRFECLKQFADGALNLVPEPKVQRRLLTRSNTTGTCRDGHTPRPMLKTSRLDSQDIVAFLKVLVSEQTSIPISKISTTANLASYGIDSIGVVRAAQKLSDYLGAPVGAVDIFTATSIEDLASFSEDILAKSQPQDVKNSSSLQEPEVHYTTSELLTEVSLSYRLAIACFQFLALIYIATLLALPAYMSISLFVKMLSTSSLTSGAPWANYIFALALAPLAWLVCIFATCSCIALFGNSFLQLNYALTPEISIWSLDYIKWWTLYKAQEVSSKVLAVHLRGTVLLKYWFQMFGAKIGSSVVLDTVDITDPALVHIGDGVVIAEGVLVQGHEMRNGILSFNPIRIGTSCLIAPYAVIQKGTMLGDGTEVAALQVTEEGKPVSKSKVNNIQKVTELPKVRDDTQNQTIHHLIGIYTIGFISSLSAAIIYVVYISLTQTPPTIENFAFLCIFGAFHWFPFTIIAYATMVGSSSLSPLIFSISVAAAYLAHGLTLSLITCLLNHSLSGNQQTWLRHRITIACHLRFSKLLSGTEAFCIYLRLMGAKVGKYCSIRAINPVVDHKLVSIGNGVHLGDFSRIVTGFYSCNGFTTRKVEVHDNVVLGSQSLVLPGSTIQDDVIIGALSVAPVNSTLQRGGVYIGSQSPIMIKNTMHELDERIEEMDTKYKKIVGNLAANLAATTLKVRTRYFHRIGVSGKGVLKIYNKINGFPTHDIFLPGKSYPVIVRHSNSLSADDDARIDARGAAIRIFQQDSNCESPILDLTLKTGKAFYARTISDFATWLVCGLPAREEHVKRAPHIRDAVWMSLRDANSFAELHYYSNICRLFRFSDGQEMYVKFKLRPSDETITEDSGKVEPIGILPPETGAIPRYDNDTRPLLFLSDDFQKRVTFPGGVRYVFQLQFRPVPHDEALQDIALDCTKPWDEAEFPFVDVGEITIDQNLSEEQSEELEFNPFMRCHEIDVIRARSASQSASIDHGRSLIYEICQHLRNNEPLPQAWRAFIEQSDVKVDLSGCPIAAILQKKNTSEVTLARTWQQTSWSIFIQPLLQTFLPYFLMAYVISGPLRLTLCANKTLKFPLQWLLPFFWVLSGTCASLACVVAKWILVGKKKDGGSALIWSKSIFMDTVWQAFKTLVGDYFMDLAGGSFFFVLWMKLMGSEISVMDGVYVDSMGAVLNPEMLEIEGGGCIGREALLFGHIYEGEGGKVKFGKIRVGEGGFVGSRAVAMPGVVVEDGGSLGSLSLAMKEEVVRSKSQI